MRKLISTRSLSINLLIKIFICFLISLPSAAMFSSYIASSYIFKNSGNIPPSMYNIITLGVFFTGIASFIISFLIATRKEIKYIKYISENVKIIADKELGSTLKVMGIDELAELSKSINSMSKQLKDKFEREREIETTKTELITNVSHDLRTPLTAIIGYIDILKDEKYSSKEEQKEYLISAYNLSIKLKKLIDELFEYTKLSNRDLSLDIADADLKSILVQMLGEYAPMLESKGLKVITHIDDDKLPVKIDIEKMVRVFDNTLSNAEKYSIKPSDIIVKAYKKKNNVMISISNKGEYIDKTKLNKMFDKFLEGMFPDQTISKAQD